MNFMKIMGGQLKNRDYRIKIDDFTDGVYVYALGFIKKILIANVLGHITQEIFAINLNEATSSILWLGSICYSLQLYYDYSDMAIGIGKIFGFNCKQNFNYPYMTKSISEFWRRWHISLGSWFKDYVYFPLGGSRVKSKMKLYFNLLVVWLLTGIWHGADWTFVVWGIYHGVLTMLETVLVKDKKDKNAGKEADSARSVIRVLGHIYTLLAVMIGFVIFRADSMRQAVHFIASMFSFGATAVGTMTAVSVMSPLFIITLIIAAVACTPVLRMLPKNAVTRLLGMVLTIILYMLCIMEIAAGSYNPFIYFRF